MCELRHCTAQYGSQYRIGHYHWRHEWIYYICVDRNQCVAQLYSVIPCLYSIHTVIRSNRLIYVFYYWRNYTICGQINSYLTICLYMQIDGINIQRQFIRRNCFCQYCIWSNCQIFYRKNLVISSSWAILIKIQCRFYGISGSIIDSKSNIAILTSQVNKR